MCLTNVGERKIAKEDLVVYKRLETIFVPQDIEKYEGKPFTGYICGYKVEGTISIFRGEMYFCTDNVFCNGEACPIKYGHCYSWRCDDMVDLKSIRIDGKTIYSKPGYKTPYQDFPIELGEEYTSTLIEQFGIVQRGLHSFTTSEDAKRDGLGTVVKCIVPATSEYYEGTFCNRPSIASNRLRYTTEVISDGLEYTSKVIYTD